MTVTADSMRVAIVEEVTQGTTPASPAFNLLRLTGEGLQFEVTTTMSDEMGGANRGVKDNILTGGQTTGEVSFELSKNVGFELLLPAAIGSDWGDDPLTITDTPTAQQVYDYMTERSFTIEKRLTVDNLTPLYDYHRFAGCAVDTLNLTIAPGDPITGSFGFIGTTMTTAKDSVAGGDAELAGATYAGAGSEPVMTAPLVTAITLLNYGTSTPVSWMANACFVSMDLTLTNNLRALLCIGQLGPSETNMGRLEISASASMYYNGTEPLDALIDRTEYGLQVTTTDEAGNSYDFLFGRVKLSASTALGTGTNTDVMADMTIAALEDSPDPITVTITRAPGAATPAAARSGPTIATANEIGVKATPKTVKDAA